MGSREKALKGGVTLLTYKFKDASGCSVGHGPSNWRAQAAGPEDHDLDPRTGRCDWTWGMLGEQCSQALTID